MAHPFLHHYAAVEMLSEMKKVLELSTIVVIDTLLLDRQLIVTLFNDWLNL